MLFVTPDDSKSGPGMIPNEPHHVAVIVSITRDGALHLGVSDYLLVGYGRPRCDQLTNQLAETVAMFLERRQ